MRPQIAKVCHWLCECEYWLRRRAKSALVKPVAHRTSMGNRQVNAGRPRDALVTFALDPISPPAFGLPSRHAVPTG